LLGLFGGDDQFPTPAETAELSRTLDSFNKAHEFHTFNGAGHAFFSVDRASYRVEAAVEGWDKIWAFFGEHLSGKA
jgi:carboxymethylenebutenolidase